MNGLKKLYIFLFFITILNADNNVSFKIFDCETKKSIDNTVVLKNSSEIFKDEFGFYNVTKNSNIKIKSIGYKQLELNIKQDETICLQPFSPKALYLSYYGIGHKPFLLEAIDLIEKTELNSLVIDIKSENGFISFAGDIQQAKELGAYKSPTIKDINKLLNELKQKGIYTIARISVFKDNLYSKTNPHLAIKNAKNELFKDEQGVSWSNPLIKEVQDYNIDIAIQAAKAGFDEIQFDYVRFPEKQNLNFGKELKENEKSETIANFLKDASEKLKPYNVYVSADIFGYTIWHQSDLGIGQKLELITNSVDYVAPMLYPSGFSTGLPKYRNPVEYPYEIVYSSLLKAKEKTKADTQKFRPWLQAFKDYAFDKRAFNAKEINLQIKASADFGSNGYMLWNPKNNYTALKNQTKPEKKKSDTLLTLEMLQKDIQTSQNN